MRPWLIVAGDFVSTGGMDAANRALALELARRGVPVHLVGHRVEHDLAALPRVTVHPVRRPLGSHRLGFPLLDRAGRRVAGALAEQRPVVVANGGNTRAPADACWIHYLHAAYRPAGLRARVGRGRLLREERRAASVARVVIANSRRTARETASLLGVPPERIRVVRYGVDAARFRPPTPAERAEARARLEVTGGATLAFVGALGDDRKGFAVVAAAWERLSAPPVLLVAGAGRALPRWRRWAETRGLADRVRFLGFQPDVRPVLWAADAILAPARYEAYGLAVHEAMCCGLPGLVSASAGVAEVIPQPLGPLLLADPADPAELVRAVECWRADREGWARAAAGAAGVLRARSWGAMADEFVDTVQGVG